MNKQNSISHFKKITLKIYIKVYFVLLCCIASALPSKLRIFIWNKITAPFKSGKSFTDRIVPTYRRGSLILPSLLRASLRSSVYCLKSFKGKFAVSDRISIGESLVYFHYSYLRAKETNTPTYAPDINIEPNTEVINFFFNKNEIIKIQDPIQQRLKTQVKKIEDTANEVKLNLYSNALVGKFIKKNRWPDLGKPYQKNNDKVLKILQKESPMLEKSYLDFLSGENFYQQIDQYIQMADKQRAPFHYPGLNAFDPENLKKTLGITQPYICLFLRPISTDITSPRSVHQPQNYIESIQYLKQIGYQVVLMGTSTNLRFPTVEKINSVIDYPRSGFQSLTNDLNLVSGCHWMITCNSGPSIIPIIFNKPTLWLNTLNPAQAILLRNHRFYPKNIIKEDGENLNWKDWLNSPALYAQHERHFKDSKLRWVDLDGNQILRAVKEFLSLVENKTPQWDKYTLRQEFFKSQTRPYHLNLHTMISAPCESFLKYIQCPE